MLPDDVASLTTFIDPTQITDYPLDIDNLLVNRQADRLAFSCQVFANLTIEQTAAKLAADKASGSLVYKFDKLFIRHWDEFMLGQRHHPFVVSIAADGKGVYSFTTKPVDVLFGIDSDSPTRPFGSGQVQWSFSATGKYFALTRQHDETSAVAWSTNLDIYKVDLTQLPTVGLTCITCDNLAADTDPSFSPDDDDVLVYRAQAVQGYESDQFKIKLYNGESSTFSSPSSHLFFQAPRNEQLCWMIGIAAFRRSLGIAMLNRCTWKSAKKLATLFTSSPISFRRPLFPTVFWKPVRRTM